MQSIAIFSDNSALVRLCSRALINHFEIVAATSKQDFQNAPVVIIEAQKVDAEIDIQSLFSNSTTRFLVVGKDWSENKQINALVNGAAGYCDESVPPKLLLHAVTSILQGDTWIQRHLVPRVIDTLVKMKSDDTYASISSKYIESSSLLSTLSSREKEVAYMIRDGKSNKTIANSLNISERTVKAHLTSIFKKLKISDRLHLALYIKEYD